MPDAYLDGLRAEDRAEMWKGAVEAARPRVGLDVIDVDGQVAGFACYGPERDDESLGELYAINFDPAYWRQGLGRRLIRHVTSELTRLGFPRAVLWVEATNDRARRFYEVEGWHADGTERTDTIESATVAEVRYARDLPG
jgi:ribosomal protein S18 acetylase RimI-like enzyme